MFQGPPLFRYIIILFLIFNFLTIVWVKCAHRVRYVIVTLSVLMTMPTDVTMTVTVTVTVAVTMLRMSRIRCIPYTFS